MTKHSPIEKIEWMRNLLAFLLVGAFVGALVIFSFIGIPVTNKDILIYMVGQLSGMAQVALGFYFINKVGADALDAKRADNTKAAFDAVVAASTGTVPTDAPADAVAAADQAVDAATEKRDEIAGAA